MPADQAVCAHRDRLVTGAGGLLIALGLALPFWGAVAVAIAVTASGGEGLLP